AGAARRSSQGRCARRRPAGPERRATRDAQDPRGARGDAQSLRGGAIAIAGRAPEPTWCALCCGGLGLDHAIDTQHNADPAAPDTALATIALRNDAYAATLDRLGLDFCCRGGRTLAEACTAAGLDVEKVLAELRAASARAAAGTVVTDW